MSRFQALSLTAVLSTCACLSGTMKPDRLREFAAAYTAAWCSQDPVRVAQFFGDSGRLTINGGTPAVGRAAIAEAARGFMAAFPDLMVELNSVSYEGARVVYRWTLSGTNTGPGGNGRRVRISGEERWRFGADGLIADSKGSFDEADYRQQLGES